MDVESWCMVENQSVESWQRAQMKHKADAMKSEIFKPDVKQTVDRSSEWINKVMEPPHRERRHFPQSRKIR